METFSTTPLVIRSFSVTADRFSNTIFSKNSCALIFSGDALILLIFSLSVNFNLLSAGLIRLPSLITVTLPKLSILVIKLSFKITLTRLGNSPLSSVMSTFPAMFLLARFSTGKVLDIPFIAEANVGLVTAACAGWTFAGNKLSNSAITKAQLNHFLCFFNKIFPSLKI